MSQSVVQKPATTGENAMMLHSSPEEESAGRVKLPQLRSSAMEVDRSKPLPTSLQSDFIPDDVLFALTQPPMARDKLGPPSRVRNLGTTTALARAPAANVWSHKRRDKFKHLLDSTACSCGAGKDISFLYDVPQEHGHPEKPDTIDKSAVRKDAEIPPKKALQLPDTLIPEEYHIVKNRGVMGIEYHEDKYTTNPDDHEKHLIVFPSMKPASRFEVMQLKKTMEDMLEKVGFNDIDTDIKGPTQMHNLLELIKKEQNIYNIVFHELIRQTSVECSDRGQLLSDLRNKYSELLSKVPQQIMSLHEEVMAQRALDRRLTDELMRFKNTIAVLTSELSDVKEHDKIVTREAQKTQEDLRHALAEAQKNAALLSEYHDLYELQRRRLEHQVFVLSEEREIWSTAAYSLALKVTEECRLTTAKRLHVSEKAWAKLANHFTILLSDRDTDLLTQIQGHVEKWRDGIEDFNIALRQREEEMKEELRGLKGGVEKWILDFQRNCFNKDGHLVKPPDKEKMQELQADFRAWEKVLSKEAEVFGGDLLLSNQDELSQIRKEMEGWTDNALKVFGRHRGTSNTVHPDQTAMMNLNDEVERLLLQYQHRITGENGVAAIVIHLQNVVETWETRIIAALNGTMTIQDSDWAAFYQGLDEWVASLDQAQAYVGTTQAEEERQDGKPHISIDIHDVVRKTQKWATTASNSVDSEDAKLVEQVSTLHSEMVRWMVQTLLRLAPDKEGNSREAAEMALLGSVSVPQLHENAKQLFQSLHTFSNYVTLCCDGIVMDNTQKRQDLNEENADHEIRDLQRLRTECEDWIHTAQILMSQLTGESIEELFPQRASTTLSKSSQPPVSMTFVDHEKLDSGAKGDKDTAPGTPVEAKDSKTSQESSQEMDAEETEGQTTGEPSAEAPAGGEGEEGEQKEEREEEADEEPEEADEPSKASSPQAPKGERMEVLGGDENTHLAGLQDTNQREMATTPVKAVGAPDTKKAFEALATVNSLQDQLLMTEQRAQEAEERASTAEMDLATAQENIRSLQKQLEKLTMKAEDTSVSQSAIASVASPAPSQPSQPAESPRQLTSADTAKSDSKKKDPRTKSSGKSKKK
ncbi:axonemal dynein light chain domain-containing protein 1-like isoform X2 [Babylonia areolata]|uniref:axonemal dynein light chain domain-containing protein 1-like isoform X2 n=1 Tax=Babylonia areolata TaxID=304850 RepID=UPI003FD14955